MLYVVEIRRGCEHLTEVMSAIREWLAAQRFEPDAFRCVTEEQTVAFRLGFKNEGEALACAEAFRGEVSLPGNKPAG